MKFLPILIVLLFSSCATMGAVLQGAGGGLTRASQQPIAQKQTYHCTSDFIGGYNCQ